MTISYVGLYLQWFKVYLKGQDSFDQKWNSTFCFFLYSYYFKCAGVLPAHLSVHHVHKVPTKARKWCWIPLELELQSIMTCPVGSGIQSPVLWKSSQYSVLCSHLSTPRYLSYDKDFQIALNINSTDFHPTPMRTHMFTSHSQTKPSFSFLTLPVL